MKRKLQAMIVTYVTIAGAIWGVAEASTYFEGEKLKLLIGNYWSLLFVVFPGIVAVIVGVQTDRSKSQKYCRPILGQILVQPASFSMRAVDRMNPQRSFQDIQACPLDTIGFTFEVTNPNTLDMRLVRLFVSVTEFTDVNICQVYTGDMGGGAIIRMFTCEIGSRVARYECIQASDGFDYIKLSSGEMETFRIDVIAPAEGVYRLMLVIEYSIAGKIGTVEADNDIQEIGFFDQTCHRIYNVSAGQWEGT